jgi:signal transduction histidine kinase
MADQHAPLTGRVVVRSLLSAAFLFALVSGVIALIGQYDLGFSVENRDGSIVVTDIHNTSLTGLNRGDRIVGIGGQSVRNLHHARWLMEWKVRDVPVPIEIEREKESLRIYLTPVRTHHPFYILLNTLLGLMFLGVGLMVGWGGRRDSKGLAYYRLVAVTACSVFLYSVNNAWTSPVLHYLHAAFRILAHCLIAPLLLDFLLRFCGHRLRKQLRRLIFLPSFLLIPALAVMYPMARETGSPEWVSWFEWTFSTPLGALMLVYFVISVVSIVRFHNRSTDASTLAQLRWILIVTVIGLFPYFFYFKLPPVFGYNPILPQWSVFCLLLIVPVGWGMAVASFRMLKVEWALSRTIIYTIAAILASYFLLMLLVIVGEPFAIFAQYSLKAQIIAGTIVLVFTSMGLANPVKLAIDRVYYRDWFNERDAIGRLGEELAQATSETAIAEIVSDKLIRVLRIDKAALLIGDADHLRLPVSGWPVESEHHEQIISIAKDLLARHPVVSGNLSDAAVPARLNTAGFELIIPLHKGNTPVGVLLIGRKLSRAMFSEKDLTLLSALSSQGAVALANVALARQLIDQEKRALAAEMAGGIAHEINNSLAPLLGQAQLAEMKLREGETVKSEEVLAGIEMIIQMSERIKRIAANLTRLSKPPQLEPEMLTLESVAEEVLLMMSETAGRTKHFSECDPESPFKLRRELSDQTVTFSGDRQQLGQIFINLIVNSADALQARGWGTVTVGVKRVENGVIGYVADDGPGIPLQLIDRIFQPYFTTKAKGKGTGLGLAIVRQIVELHGGKLSVESEPGHGARFDFFIPVL